MNRRGFLKLLGVGAAAVAPAIILPERRIWAVGFGAPRDVHAALGGTTIRNFGELLKERYGNPSSLRELRAHIAEHDRSLAMRIGSQGLTFDTEAARRWLSEQPIVQQARGYAGEWQITNATMHSVLWTSITASET